MIRITICFFGQGQPNLSFLKINPTVMQRRYFNYLNIDCFFYDAFVKFLVLNIYRTLLLGIYLQHNLKK
jgi:hypothetical protein